MLTCYAAPLPMTAEYMNRIHTIASADGGIYVPSVLKELAKTPSHIENMKSLRFVAFGG
jgi:hypothetical protein